MKKNMIKRIAAIITIAIMVFSIFNIKNLYAKEQKIDSFEYSIGSNDYRWQFMSIKEKRDALLIPEDILSKMTNNCLLESFLKYPFLCDILAYSTGDDDYTDALEKMSKYCSAYQEILKRGLTVHEMLFSLDINENNIGLPNSEHINLNSNVKEVINKIEDSDKYSEGDILTIKVILRGLQREAIVNPVIYKKLACR